MPAQNPPAELPMSLTLGGGPTVGRLGFGAMRPPRRREHWLCIVDPCLRFRIGVTQRKRGSGATHATAHIGLGSASGAIS
jgi:hypothetical protein